ncbi:MAG: hypothetical protein ACRDQF_18105, partial [Thermocrispum sp.]
MTLFPGGMHGAYLRSDLVRSVGAYAVRIAVYEGTLSTFCRGVLIEARTATTMWTRAAAALLLAGPDAAISGFTVLELHGCTATPGGPIDVIAPYYRKLRRRPGVAAHHGRFTDRDVVHLHDVRVMTISHSLAEVLCRGSRDHAFACADQVLAQVPRSRRAELRADVEKQIMARHDPRGRRSALTLLPLASGSAESPAESRCFLRLYDAGLPAPQRQY